MLSPGVGKTGAATGGVVPATGAADGSGDGDSGEGAFGGVDMGSPSLRILALIRGKAHKAVTERPDFDFGFYTGSTELRISGKNNYCGDLTNTGKSVYLQMALG